MRLRVRKLARAEIQAAFVWYLARSSQAASDFLDAVDDAINSIERAPKRQAIIRGQLRRRLLKGFPYAVYYKLYPRMISVVGVIHGRRHPAVWIRRV